MDWPIEALRTNRLVVRAATSEDRPLFERVLTDPAIRRHLGGPVPDEDLERRVTSIPWRGVFAVDRASDDASIGMVHVGRYRTGDVELSYEFLPEHWGRGYAEEACSAVLVWTFRYVAVGERIIAVTQEANEASVRLLSRLGMSPCDRFDEWGERQVMMQVAQPVPGSAVMS